MRNLRHVGNWSPLQFARVSLGGLGVVTSVTLDVMERQSATTLTGGVERVSITDRNAFVEKFRTLKDHSRLETFFTPYATSSAGSPLYAKNFLALWWDVKGDPSPRSPNVPPNPRPDACVLASNNEKGEYGAPYMKGIANYGAEAAERAQYAVKPGNTLDGVLADGLENPAVIAAITFDVIEPDVNKANKSHSEMWLSSAVRVIFMSYYIPLPAVDDDGLRKVWDGLDVVSRIVTKDGNFHIAAPMEFRFVKGGDTAMSGTFTRDPENTWFINLDLIGFVPDEKKASEYSPVLLQFFADVEREWVKMDGFPHQGKMYGFYDPTAPKSTHTAPFNRNFLVDLRRRRDERLEAFNGYRKSLDPNGLFYNDYLPHLLES